MLFSSYTNTVIAQDKNQKPSTLKLESNEDFLREELVGGPHEFELDFNLPDPFTTKTTLYFAIPNETNLELSIYNQNWELVRSLIDGTVEKGYYKIEWDGTDQSGNFVGNGVYHYRLKADDFDQSAIMYYLSPVKSSPSVITQPAD